MEHKWTNNQNELKNGQEAYKSLPHFSIINTLLIHRNIMKKDCCASCVTGASDTILIQINNVGKTYITPAGRSIYNSS